MNEIDISASTLNTKNIMLGRCGSYPFSLKRKICINKDNRIEYINDEHVFEKHKNGYHTNYIPFIIEHCTQFTLAPQAEPKLQQQLFNCTLYNALSIEDGYYYYDNKSFHLDLLYLLPHMKDYIHFGNDSESKLFIERVTNKIYSDSYGFVIQHVYNNTNTLKKLARSYGMNLDYFNYCGKEAQITQCFPVWLKS